MPKSLAIIPARGGSKRIPRKNIRPFAGKPIIVYSIEAAIRSGCFQSVMASTDDPEIAEVAGNAGAEVPFFRSERTATDHATLADVVGEVLASYRELGEAFDYFCCILPTAPFLRPEWLRNGFERLSRSDADSVFPIVRFGYPILRALRIENGTVKMMWPEHLNTRSNDLEPAYHDCGLFYWMRTDRFLAQKRLLADRSIGIELPETETQDIDTEEDWRLAELKFQLLRLGPVSAPPVL
jgi:pseudaminic acid cytidylyltransferase